MSAAVSNQIKFMRTSQHGHQSNYQAPGKLRVEGDIEARIQALIAKDGIRIREFFLDFDKLRKGTVGEAAVSTPSKSVTYMSNICLSIPVQNIHWNSQHQLVQD